MNKSDILKLLTEIPKARSRKYKNKALAYLFKDRPMNDDTIGDILNADRWYRLLLAEHPELRGNDYEDKDILSQAKVLDLGYSVRHEEFIHKSKEL